MGGGEGGPTGGGSSGTPADDGHEAEARRQRFVEQGGILPVEPGDRALLDAIAGSGEFLPELLLADVTALPRLVADPWLRRAKPADTIAREVREATAGAADLRELKRRLRRARRYEMLRLGVRELGWGTTEEVARELSAFADACLEAAVEVAERELRDELGPPRTEAGEPARFVVMAMGKLGGEELNFSSDIDVCYFYSTDAGAAGEHTLHHYYAELSRRVSAAVEESTEDGMVFRVDLRLRPEGRNGPLCNSLAAAESYYETFGRTWERQAWLRARPAAGDRALGHELLSILEPFIYPRSIDPKMIDDVRGLRALFRDPADAAGALGETGFDVKLGSGGIRDVEMVVQALQLLHAGKRPDLREANTPKALPRLVVAGLLSDREASTLLGAYRFWRRLEHRVQVATGAQRHRIPGDDGPRAHFARRLGFSELGAFDAEVAAKRAAVEAIAATLGEPPPDMNLEAARLLDPMRGRDELERLLAAAGFRDVDSAADTLEAIAARLPVSLMEEAIASPDPDRALTHFRDLVWRGSAGLLDSVQSNPQLAGMLGTLFGTSDQLAALLVRHPALWGGFLEGLGARLRSRDEMGARLRERILGRGTDGEGAGEDVGDGEGDGEREESRSRAIRRFQTEEILRIGMNDVAGNLEAGEVGAELSDLAEVCLEAGIETVLPAVEGRLGRPGTSLTVLGLGSLGAREMRYGSDLDLVFLFGEEGESTKGIDHREWFARGSQRVISFLEAMLEEGRLYQVDTRLRPSGEQGLLVTSWQGFQRYHETEAAAWERVALLRARIVYSNEEGEKRRSREEALAAIAHRPFASPDEDARFRTDLRRIRGRVEKERGRVPAGSRHLRFDPGGIMDIELLTALGQIRHAADAVRPGLKTTVTEAALSRLVDLGWPPQLADDYFALRRAALRMRLLLERPGDVVSPRDLPILARSLGTSTDTLAADLETRMTRTRATFDTYFSP